MNLLSLAPVIGSFLAGPAGNLAGAGLQWLAGKFGASDSTVDAITKSLQGFAPSDALALRKLDIEFQEFCLANGIQVQLAQIATNTEEAKSSSIFVAGWRPFVGWTCGVALAYVGIIEPVARFFALVGFHYNGAFPVIDTSLTMQVLLGMLGIAGLRSFDKLKGN